jgi:hypothetical protein
LGARLSRTCGNIGLIVAAVLATWRPADAEEFEVRNGKLLRALCASVFPFRETVKN